MPDESKKKPFVLIDTEKKRRLAYAVQLRDLIKDCPELIPKLLIVSTDGHVLLHPDEMTVMEIVGVLECAKYDVLHTSTVEEEEEDEDDS